VQAAHCSIPEQRFARLVKPRCKLGQVCDPRWTISRPNDELLLSACRAAVCPVVGVGPAMTDIDAIGILIVIVLIVLLLAQA
jgi:hypothetical protein